MIPRTLLGKHLRDIHGDPANSPLRDLIAAAIYEHNQPLCRWTDATQHNRDDYRAQADAVLAVILPSARITATLARMSEADVQRVIDLYERWVKAGPPPLGTSMSRWWDERLVELRAAIHPPETDDATTPTTSLIPQDRALERVEALAYRWETALPADLPYARSLRAALAGPSEPS
ncbi:hypothetical protein UK15_07805 [Streptomyces variegatus]|uniref:Uncharacterized protein n=1 Tax=Streptomyces variegatus TaxID=284040 RepID=A0A0M2GVS6_9ACTN|nr:MULTISPECIES: hypothetical protein [Streptomyces]KJK40245.1 hypothetical protein UK15_07805 [Streptomyces variegatus]